MMLLRKCLFPALLTFTLTACNNQPTNVNQLAYHTAQQVLAADFDPNTQTALHTTTQNMAKFLQQFYDLGKEDRSKGISAAQVEQRIASFRAPDFLPELGQRSEMLNKTYSSDAPNKKRQIMVDNAISAYRLGYQGHL